MIRIHKQMVVDNEHLYGPGKRLLLYLKGCNIHCDGCINQHLWPFTGGTLLGEDDIINICKKEDVEGITLHGGEPLDQSGGLLDIIKSVKKEGLTTILFTGYIKKELNKTQIAAWNLSDIVIAGRFKKGKSNYNLQFRGSSNQRVYIHKGQYYGYKVKDGFSTAILTINENGEMDINGFLTDDIRKFIEED